LFSLVPFIFLIQDGNRLKQNIADKPLSFETNNQRLTEHKQMRSVVRNRRRRLTDEQQRQAAQQVYQRLEHHTRIERARNISLFLSFDGELNTQPLIELLWQKGKSVFLPILHPFSPGHLLFLAYTPQTQLISHPFGLKQPALDVRRIIPTDNLDIVFTPLVAFDDNGNRLGMGGGYYDRTLQHWRQKDIYPIGLAHDCQQVDRIETADWDIPLPEIITPSKRWLFNKS
jgi:5-formyltetrahydrofolate cyclo-ligase